MGFKGHVINSRIDGDLPFYSQVLLTSSSFHKNNKESQDGSTNTFLFKSTDPRITASDIKNILLHNEQLSKYFNLESSEFEITEKGNHLYHTQLQNKNLDLPKVLTSNYTPSFYSDDEPYLSKQLRIQPKPLNVAKIQKMCDEYMSKYDLEKELSKKLKQKVVKDEEGFQLVTAGPLPVKSTSLEMTKKRRRKSKMDTKPDQT